MLKEVYENARVINTGKYKTTVNELTDQIPALRPELLQYAAKAVIESGDFKTGKILCEEDKGAPLGTAVSLMTGLPLAIARWYPYEIPGEQKVPFTCEYTEGTLYLNGLEKDDDIIIVEDTISTGGTLISLIKAVQEKGANLREVIALVDKVDNKGVARVFNETGVEVKTIFKITIENDKVKALTEL